eukprot:scaffold5593_cov125-Isochrysis_galbana.AAC.9
MGLLAPGRDSSGRIGASVAAHDARRARAARVAARGADGGAGCARSSRSGAGRRRAAATTGDGQAGLPPQMSHLRG